MRSPATVQATHLQRSDHCLGIAYAVIVGLNDGGWLLLVPAIAAAAVIVWPVRGVLAIAILLTAIVMILGLMTVGIFYGFSLAALIFALAALRSSPVQPR